MATAYFCPYCGADNAPGEKLCRACQQSLAESDAALNAVTLLNERYEVLTQIGSGGFGAVYKARDTREDNRFVAIKQINLAGLSAQEVIEATDAFNREAQILSTLSHPLLPRIFDRFSDPEHWYLVLNFIDGQTLDAYLQECVANALPVHAGLPLDETLAIGLQLCDVLHYLHSQQPPVIFRDLKPGNIMCTTSRSLYLIDFGIARRFKPGQARDTIPFGSPGFAAPEQYGKAQTTPQADIYSLGALLHCLLTGDDPSEHPFNFPPLRIYRANGTRELEALIQRMVALAPEQRPASIQEVQSELQSIQNLHKPAQKQAAIWTPPQGQTPPTPSTTTGNKHKQSKLTPAQIYGRKHTRRSLLISGLIGIGTVSLGGLAISFLRRNSASAGISPAAMTAIVQNAEATAEAQAKKLAAVPANGPTYWSPDLSHAAVINTTTQQLELYKVQGKQLLHTLKPQADLSSANSFDYTVWWTEDNSKILFASDTALAWDVSSGQQLFTLSAYSFELAAAWSPSGKFLALGYPGEDQYGQPNTDFALLRAGDGKRLFQTSFVSENVVSSLAWSPDDKYLVFPNKSLLGASYSPSALWSVEIWNSNTHQQVSTLSIPIPSNITISSYTATYLAWSPEGDKLSISFGQTIWIYPLAKGASIYKLANITYNILNCGPIWSPNGEFLAILLDGKLTVLNVANGQPIHIQNSTKNSYLIAFAWSADSKGVIAADLDNILSRWSVG